jgi:Uma2 family endonuclease
MKVGIPKMTLAQLDALPDDGNRYELIEGDLFVTPAPRAKHQRVVMELGSILHMYAKAHKLGIVFPAPTDVRLRLRETRVQPDILFVSAERAGTIGVQEVSGAPNLVVEVLSESTKRADLEEKRQAYERAGIEEYWIVEPDQCYVLVYRFAESPEPRELSGSDKLTTPLLPGLEITVSEIFPS